MEISMFEPKSENVARVSQKTVIEWNQIRAVKPVYAISNP